MNNSDKILDFYDSVRDQIGNGTIGLVSKPAFVSKFIRNHDREIEGVPAEWSHVFSIVETGFAGKRRVQILDSNGDGVKPHFLSDLLRECDNVMFLIPTCDKETIEKALAERWDRAQNGIKYDFKNGLKELWNRSYGRNTFKFKIKPRDEHDICSDECAPQFIAQGMASDKFISLPITFPADFDRYSNILTVKEIRYKG